MLAGGYFGFTVAGTTTPANVYGDRALSTNNGNTIDIDASGRLEHECWASTANAFFVEVYDAADVKQGESLYVEVSGGAGQSIPVPSEGEFLTGDGTNFLVAEVRQVPDPTGNANKLLGTDGEDLNWVARPSDGAAGVSDTSTSATGYTVGNKRRQWGTGTGTNVGGRSQNATVTFPVPFSATPSVIDINVTNSGGLSSTTCRPIPLSRARQPGLPCGSACPSWTIAVPAGTSAARLRSIGMRRGRSDDFTPQDRASLIDKGFPVTLPYRRWMSDVTKALLALQGR